MGYASFLATLFEEGRVSVPEFAPLDVASIAAGDETLAHYEQIYRLELPEPVPEFNAAASRWGAIWIMRACQFAIYRDLGQELLTKSLGHVFPEPSSTEVHYSVDLVMRYLPDITRFASIASEQDPLLNHLRQAASQWPLSSVGMSNVEVGDLSGIVNHAGLLRLYVDRILATGDKIRVQHPAVQQAIRQALGFYPQFAQNISNTLTELATQDSM